MSRADGGYNPITGRSGEILSEAFRVQVTGGFLSGHQSSWRFGFQIWGPGPSIVGCLGWWFMMINSMGWHEILGCHMFSFCSETSRLGMDHSPLGPSATLVWKPESLGLDPCQNGRNKRSFLLRTLVCSYHLLYPNIPCERWCFYHTAWQLLGSFETNGDVLASLTMAIARK